MESFQVLSNPKRIYAEMLNSINSAKKSIFLETYIYDNDKTGKKFRNALTKKVSQGVKVKLFLDGWGSQNISEEYFKKLIDAGGEVRYFKEFRYVIRILSKNHERNHRKLLIIDGKTTFIGSINITDSCLNWRELVLKFSGPLTEHFSESFNHSWDSTVKFSKKKINLKVHKGFEILHDVPRNPSKLTQSKYSRLIKSARKEILIETPYFVPPIHIRRALAHAVEKGVEVKILLPQNSDQRFVDLFRNRYFGYLHRAGIKIFFYTPGMLHSKLLLIDDKFFLFGSSNLDYRSFLHQHEINLFGRDKGVILLLKSFFNSGVHESKPFSYNEWRSRSSFSKIIELALHIVAKYL